MSKVPQYGILEGASAVTRWRDEHPRSAWAERDLQGRRSPVPRDYLLSSFVGDPVRENRQSLNDPPGLFCFTYNPFRKQAFFGLSVKQKTPLTAGHLSSAEKEGFEPPVPR